MLSRAGRDAEALECGAHWSISQKVLIHQARTLDAPTALHNNCSGKHAGFICACCHQDIDPKGYVGYQHPLQVEIRAAMESLTGAVLGAESCGTDGCSIPTYAVPLRSLAHGFAKMVTGTGLEPLRAKASRRLIEACMGIVSRVGETSFEAVEGNTSYGSNSNGGEVMLRWRRYGDVQAFGRIPGGRPARPEWYEKALSMETID